MHTDEGECIEEGTERKRRAPTVTESTLYGLGYHDGIHGLTDKAWSREPDDRRGRLAARYMLAGFVQERKAPPFPISVYYLADEPGCLREAARAALCGVERDAGRARIVGETSLGNVEVLNGYRFDDGSQVWIAAETFDSAFSDTNWELSGIVPDVSAYAEWDTITYETDPSIKAAVELLGH